VRKLTPDETAKLYGEIRELEARAKARGSGLTPDLEALAARIFGEEKAPDFGDSLERLTVALVALRTAFDPNGQLGREPFLALLERLGRAAGSVPVVPRGEISKEAPDLLMNPAFWLSLEGLREKALSGDKPAAALLDRVLDVLRVPKRRADAGRAAAAAARIETARELLRDSDFMAAPLSRLAVEIARGGKRGPVPLRAPELVVSAFPELALIHGLEAERKRSRDPERRRVLREAAEKRRAALARLALALEGQRDRAAKRTRGKTRGRK
jgi:hypothetical protein